MAQPRSSVLAYDSRRLVAPIPCRRRQFVRQSMPPATTGDCFPIWQHATSRSLPDSLLAAAGAAFGGFLTNFADLRRTAWNQSLPASTTSNTTLAALDRCADDGPRQWTAELRQIDALRAAFPIGSGRRQLIHGDCKVNNLLFDPGDNAVLAIIDLDTLMFGDPAWDFGDSGALGHSPAAKNPLPRSRSRANASSACAGASAAAFDVAIDEDRPLCRRAGLHELHARRAFPHRPPARRRLLQGLQAGRQSPARSFATAFGGTIPCSHARLGTHRPCSASAAIASAGYSVEGISAASR